MLMILDKNSFSLVLTILHLKAECEAIQHSNIQKRELFEFMKETGNKEKKKIEGQLQLNKSWKEYHIEL